MGDVVENWKEFENSWDYYLIATNLGAKMKTAEGEEDTELMEIVVATLCTVIGAE